MGTASRTRASAASMVAAMSSPSASAGTPIFAATRRSAEAPVYQALSTMRDQRSHLALVDDDGQLLGLVTMHDLLDRLLPVQGSTA